MPYYLFDPSALDPENQSQPYCFKKNYSQWWWSDLPPRYVDECYQSVEEAKEAQRQCKAYGFETVMMAFETGAEVEPESKTEVWVVSSAFESKQAAIEFAEKQNGEWYVGRATVKVSTQVKIEEV